MQILLPKSNMLKKVNDVTSVTATKVLLMVARSTKTSLENETATEFHLTLSLPTTVLWWNFFRSQPMSMGFGNITTMFRPNVVSE